MPTYVCVVEAGLLNDQQKQRIASAITRLHGETTGAPTWLAQVVIDENEQRQRYLSGQRAELDRTSRSILHLSWGSMKTSLRRSSPI